MEAIVIPANENKPRSLRSDRLVVEELGSELMIYDQARNQAFCLNQTAAFVWKHCDGNTSVSEMAVQLGAALKGPAEEEIIEFAVQKLSADGLLEPAAFLPFVSAGISRRELMQKVGVRAAIALPMVTALMVATPKAHASSKGSGNGGKPPHKKH
jgi:coenzyme PQQ synthesis protein D (PqqD)